MFITARSFTGWPMSTSPHSQANSWQITQARRASDAVAGTGRDRQEAARLRGRAVDAVDLT